MANARSFAANGQFDVIDLTQTLNLIPNMYGKINNSGLFTEEYISQDSFQFEIVDNTFDFVQDSLRGERHNVNRGTTRSIKSIYVPHFTLDDAITAADVKGKRAYGSDRAETIDAVRMRKMEQIRRSWDVSFERAKCQALVDGTVYSPNNTVNINWYDEFGITRKEVNFALNDPLTNLLEKIEEVVAHTQDNLLTGTELSEVVSYVSPEFFNALINHNTVQEAYKFYSSTQQPLRDRQGSGAMDREFVYGGMRFVEYRTAYSNGYRAIPAKEGRSVPMGINDMFKFVYAPSSKLNMLNTMAEKQYLFEYADQFNEKVLLQSESNFAAVLRRPAAVVRIFTS